MQAERNQLIGLIGFIISGLIFLAASIVNGDWWTFAGATVWIIACGFWLVPFVRD